MDACCGVPAARRRTRRKPYSSLSPPLCRQLQGKTHRREMLVFLSALHFSKLSSNFKIWAKEKIKSLCFCLETIFSCLVSCLLRALGFTQALPQNPGWVNPPTPTSVQRLQLSDTPTHLLQRKRLTMAPSLCQRRWLSAHYLRGLLQIPLPPLFIWSSILKTHLDSSLSFADPGQLASEQAGQDRACKNSLVNAPICGIYGLTIPSFPSPSQHTTGYFHPPFDF